MAQQEGPFSEYLQMAKMTPQVQVPQPTGLEGGGAAIGNIAMNFINGLRQGRMQKYAMQQMEEQKKFDAYQDAIKTVAASDLPDAEKQRLSTQLSMPLIQRIAGDKQATSKETGNPLTDVLKNMAIGLVGGQAPKKSMDLPMDPVVEALRAASDPSRSRTRILSQYDAKARARIADILRDNPTPDSAIFSKDRILQSIQDEAAQAIGLGIELPSIKRVFGEYRARTQAEDLQLKEKQRQEQAEQRASIGIEPLATQPSEVSPATGAPPPAAGGALAPTTDTAGVAKTAQPPVFPPVSTTTTSPSKDLQPEPKAEYIPLDPRSFFSHMTDIAQSGKMAKGRGLIGPPEEYIIDGKKVIGQLAEGTIGGKTQTGVYLDGRFYTSGFSKPTKYDEIPSPKLIQDTYSATVDELPKLVGDKDRLDKYKAELDVYRNTGNIEKMRDLPSQIRMAESRIKAQQLKSAGRSDEDFRHRRNEYDRDYRSAVNSVLSNGVVRSYGRLKASFNNAINAYNEYWNKLKTNQYLPKEQTAFLDNLLITLAAKSSDEMTGVREGERKIWSELSGAVTELKKRLANLAGDKNDRLTNESRAIIHSHLKRLLASYNEGVQEAKGTAKSLVEASAYRYKFDSPEEQEKIKNTFDRMSFGETTAAPPPSGAGGGRRLLETAPAWREDSKQPTQGAVPKSFVKE